jgi:molecular chaperone DnaK
MQLRKDVAKGTDIDLEFEVSESRDLTVKAHITTSGQDFSEVFKATSREVRTDLLTEEIQLLEKRVESEHSDAIAAENYEAAQRLERLRAPVRSLEAEALLLPIDDVTDDRYKLEDQKRKIAQELSRLTANKRLDRCKTEYHELRAEVEGLVTECGNDHERRQLNEITAREHTFLVATDVRRLEAELESLHRIRFQILRRTPEFLVSWFKHLIGRPEVFNDQIQAKSLIDSGRQHIATENFDRLAEINSRLTNLLPQQQQDSVETRRYTGIG